MAVGHVIANALLLCQLYGSCYLQEHYGSDVYV